MRKEIVRCDHCGADMSDDEKGGRVELRAWQSAQLEWDICSSCIEPLRTFFKDTGRKTR